VATKRLRRSPERARSEILEAAEAVFRERALPALTVDVLMERTGMTRSSFYHYFGSLEDVVIALFEQVEAEVSGSVDAWLEGAGDGAADDADREASTVMHLTRMYEVWREHAGLMQAMEQAAGRSRLAYEQWRGRVVDGYIAKTTAFIEREIACGRCSVRDPEAIASALILMNVSVASDQVQRADPDSPERLGAAVGAIWNAAIYRKN
jgi:AcrR family transcriptional regulator